MGRDNTEIPIVDFCMKAYPSNTIIAAGLFCCYQDLITTMSFLLNTSCRQDFGPLFHPDSKHGYRSSSFSHLRDREAPGPSGYRNRLPAGMLRRNGQRCDSPRGSSEMGSDFVISLFFFCGPRPNSFPTNYMIKCPGK